MVEPATVVQSWTGPIQHGDTLVLGFRGKLTQEQAVQVRDRFADLLPGVAVVMLDDVAQIAVYRP